MNKIDFNQIIKFKIKIYKNNVINNSDISKNMDNNESENKVLTSTEELKEIFTLDDIINNKNKLLKDNDDLKNIKSIIEVNTNNTKKKPIYINDENNHKKTKKIKSSLNFTNKSKLWEIFDSDKKDIENDKLQCIYNQNREMDLCSICNSILMIMDDGFPTCTNVHCGIIYKNTLDYSPEWRFYGADDKMANDPTRCGNPINPLLLESSYGCKILCSMKSSYEMKKIRRWTEWQSMPHKEKSLYEEFQFITTMAQNSGIPKIFIDDAMAIHKDISEQKMFRGLNRDGMKAASIYISCRLNGCPRTSNEIAKIFKLDNIIIIP